MAKEQFTNQNVVFKPYLSKLAFRFWSILILTFIIYLFIRFIIVGFEEALYFIIAFIIMGGNFISILRLGIKKKIPWYYKLLKEELKCPKCNHKMEWIGAEDFGMGMKHGIFIYN